MRRTTVVRVFATLPNLFVYAVDDVVVRYPRDEEAEPCFFGFLYGDTDARGAVVGRNDAYYLGFDLDRNTIRPMGSDVKAVAGITGWLSWNRAPSVEMSSVSVGSLHVAPSSDLPETTTGRRRAILSANRFSSK